jgi:hypothetical protein
MKQVARIQGHIRSVEWPLSEIQGHTASSLQRGSPGLLTSITAKETGFGERPSRWGGSAHLIDWPGRILGAPGGGCGVDCAIRGNAHRIVPLNQAIDARVSLLELESDLELDLGTTLKGFFVGGTVA